MSKNVFLASGAGAAAALIWMIFAATMPGAIVLVQIPLFAMGLTQGLVSGLIACGTAFVILLAVTSFMSAKFFALVVVFPVLILLYLGLQSRQGTDENAEWYPVGYLLAWLSVLALAYLFVAGIYFSAKDGGLEGASSELLETRLSAIFGQFSVEQMNELVAVVTRFFPATILGLWQMTAVAAGILAQGLVARFGLNIRRFTPLSEFILPRWIGFALIACVIGSLAPGQIGYLGQNGAIIAAIPFFFLGLSVIHAVSYGLPGRNIGLPLLYLFVVLLSWPALIVVGLGIVEQWYGLRRRFAPHSTDQEEE